VIFGGVSLISVEEMKTRNKEREEERTLTAILVEIGPFWPACRKGTPTRECEKGKGEDRR